ncbi:MAG: hypothetical protein NVV72_16105 [Asticcacaulis sp.]|nr:hypothetical protein [Asticcacaulis sp.]
MIKSILIAAGLLTVVTPAFAKPKTPAATVVDPAPAPAAVPLTQVEIYRIAPGQHQAFLEFIAKCDEANTLAGLPPRQLYVHSDGADWDFMIIQPAHTPPEKAAALDAAWDKVGLPSGSNFFFEIRKYIAEHTDTAAKGPTTAADYLATASR